MYLFIFITLNYRHSQESSVCLLILSEIRYESTWFVAVLEHKTVKYSKEKVPPARREWDSLAPEGSWQGEHDLADTMSITPEPPALAAHRRQQAAPSRPGDVPAHLGMRSNHWDNAQMGSRSHLVSSSPGTQNPDRHNHTPWTGAVLW